MDDPPDRPRDVYDPPEPRNGAWVQLKTPKITYFALALMGFIFLRGLVKMGNWWISAQWPMPAGLVVAAAVVSIFALVIVGTLIASVVQIPRMAAHQGIRVDLSGIAFVQEPKWWISGRRLDLPWSEVHAIVGRVGKRRFPPAAFWMLEITTFPGAVDGESPSWVRFVPPATLARPLRTTSSQPRLLVPHGPVPGSFVRQAWEAIGRVRPELLAYPQKPNV